MKKLLPILLALPLAGCLGPFSASHSWAEFVTEDVTESDLGAQAFYTATVPLAVVIYAFDLVVWNPLTWLYNNGVIVGIPEGPGPTPPRD